MIKKLEVNSENSKVVDGDLYITAVLAQGLVKSQRSSVDHNSKITFPKMGQLVKYNGEFNRK